MLRFRLPCHLSFASFLKKNYPLRITLSASDLHLSRYEADNILEEPQIVSQLVGTQAGTIAVNLGTRRQDVQKLVQCAKHLSEKYFLNERLRLQAKFYKKFIVFHL